MPSSMGTACWRAARWGDTPSPIEKRERAWRAVTKQAGFAGDLRLSFRQSGTKQGFTCDDV